MNCRVLAVVSLFLLALGVQARAADPAAKIDFTRDIRPILAKNCFACHGPDDAHVQAGLRLDTQDRSRAKLESNSVAIVPGKPDESELIARVVSTDEAERMPPPKAGAALLPEQVTLLKQWIAEGADYTEHWSFVKPVRPPQPAVKLAGWPRNGIDYYILAKLEANGLTPNAEADRYALIRRLSLDLRGLPPTPAEVEQFVNDAASDAYEKLVDRLLDDPAYGERWGRMWLDLARYADSMGLGSDPLRLNIWRYRDWVIDAFNRNLPYDQFTIEQLAGDLLPNATLEQQMATAFHRNTMTNTEGGTDDEEWRVAAVKDRVDVTMQVWMGLTMGCAKCHNHKYDPITQPEYYRFFDYFNQTADADRGDESPLLAAPTGEIAAQNRKLDERVGALKAQLDKETPELIAAQAAWEATLATKTEWVVLDPQESKSSGGATLAKQPDGAVLVSGTLADQDTYTIATKTNLKGVTAYRLETLPDASLPNGGSGRTSVGDFVLSRFSVTAVDAAKAGQPVRGRFVRVELPGDAKILSLAEVQVQSGGQNVARAGKATQSSVDYEGPANLAIDGNTNGNYYEAKSVTHTKSESNPWWEVDLGQEQPIDQVVVWNRTDNGSGARLANFRMLVLNGERKEAFKQDVAESPNPSRDISPSGVRAVTLAQAQADFSQDGFPVANAITQKDIAASGWAVGPQQNQPHAAYFIASAPLDAADATLLTFRLEQLYRDKQHSLGKFRLSVTADRNVLNRLSIPADKLAIIDTPTGQRTDAQKQALAAYYRTIAPALQPVRDEIAALEKTRPVIPMLPVMQELPEAQHRKTRVMIKGNFLDLGDEVQHAVPAHFHSFPSDAPQNRLGVAQWLVHPDNPLTARVAVNRFWSQLFGIGLVETEEDFGTQGTYPSHPELLDWLAVEFREHKWDIKGLLKTIVCSAAYRQSSLVTPEKLEKDPRDRLLSRAPRLRLEAEMVRDQALALSGLLSHKTHGPSVYPYQPPGLWQAAFNGQRNWATSEGPDRYRRGLYTFWRRTVPYPSMAVFDAPSRETCTIRRPRTNTPLQAFVTMNDPVYVECAQSLARRVVKEGGATPAERVGYAIRLCLSRPASESQVATLRKLFESELAFYREHAAEAKDLASDPLGPLPEGMDAAELAAWTVVANVLLNLDGVLTKG